MLKRIPPAETHVSKTGGTKRAKLVRRPPKAEAIASAFERISELVDLSLLARSTVTIVGLGSGGLGSAKALAASGVHSFVLIDRDIFAPHNIGTTSIGHSACGKTKVDVACAEILDINPDAYVVAFQQRHDEILERALRRAVFGSNLTIQATDSAPAAYDLNRLAFECRRDVVHLGTHPGNRSYEIIGSLGGSAAGVCGCYRCFAMARTEAFEAGDIREGESFPAYRLSANMRNAVAAYAAIGLLHHRAGSPLPISAWGAAFERLPCWVGRLAPDGFGAPGQLFADVPPDVAFGLRAYREPLPPGFVCPVCATRGA